MTLYQDSSYPVPPSLDACHGEEIAQFGDACGTLSAAERAAVLTHARTCRAAAGLQSRDDGTVIDATAVLPPEMLDLVEAIAVRPATLERTFYDAARAAGMSDAEYVETVSLVARVVNLDVFARALGLRPRPLAPPDDAEADYDAPASAVAEGAWVPSIPFGDAGGDAGRALYGEGMQPFIYRAVSLVPAEAARVIAVGNAQYLALEHFFDFGYAMQDGMSRAQVELVAARVSAHNACFY